MPLSVVRKALGPVRAVYRNYRIGILLWSGVALLLVTALYAPGFTVTEDRHRYEAVEIDHDGDALSVTDVESGTEYRGVPEMEGVACRLQMCDLVQQVKFRPDFPAVDVTGARPGYAYDYQEGEFVRFVETRRDDEMVLSVEPIEAEAVFDRLALEEERLTSVERTAIREGEVLTEERTETNRLLEFDGDYYLLESSGTYEGEIRKPHCGSGFFGFRGDSFCASVRSTLLLESLLTGLGYAVGFALVGQAYRRAIGHEWTSRFGREFHWRGK